MSAQGPPATPSRALCTEERRLTGSPWPGRGQTQDGAEDEDLGPESYDDDDDYEEDEEAEGTEGAGVAASSGDRGTVHRRPAAGVRFSSSAFPVGTESRPGVGWSDGQTGPLGTCLPARGCGKEGEPDTQCTLTSTLTRILDCPPE